MTICCAPFREGHWHDAGLPRGFKGEAASGLLPFHLTSAPHRNMLLRARAFGNKAIRCWLRVPACRVADSKAWRRTASLGSHLLIHRGELRPRAPPPPTVPGWMRAGTVLAVESLSQLRMHSPDSIDKTQSSPNGTCAIPVQNSRSSTRNPWA